MKVGGVDCTLLPPIGDQILNHINLTEANPVASYHTRLTGATYDFVLARHEIKHEGENEESRIIIVWEHIR